MKNISLLLLSLFSLLCHHTNGLSIRGANANEQHHVRRIATFPPDIAPENLAVRTNGQILMTASNQNNLYQIDPTTNDDNKSYKIIHTFEGVTSLTGIAEIEKDVFVTIIGNFSFSTFVATPKSFSLWKVDMRGERAAVHKIVDIPELLLPNGMTYIGDKDILVADSRLGGVFRMNTCTGHYSLIDDSDPLMKPVTDDPTGIQFGINGIQRLLPSNKDNEIIFSNTDQNLIAKVKLGHDHKLVGNSTKIGDAVCDDLISAPNGDIHVASNNAITTLHAGGYSSQFNFTSLGPQEVRLTALKYGRTGRYTSTLFGTVIVYGGETNTGWFIGVDNY